MQPSADTLAAHPDAWIRSLSLHATADRLWRVDHATGPPDALDDIENAFRTADYYADCLAAEDCGATQTTQVLDHTDDTLVLYSDWERTPTCASVPHIARDHLGNGVLFETRHESRHYTWRIIHSSEGDVAAFFQTLRDAVGNCAQMEMLRSTETAGAGGEISEGHSLSPEQEAALRAAVEHGYYESPRNVDEKLRSDLPDGSARVKILGEPDAYEVDWWSPGPSEDWGPVERREFDDLKEPDEVAHLA